MIYQNFDLEITSPRNGQLRARVLASPQGDCPFIAVRWPFDADEENEFLADIHGSPRQGRTGPRRLVSVQEFGGKLFEAVFSGDIEHLFRSSRDTAFRSGKGLRILLRLAEDSALHATPWEYLFDTEAREFLALREHTPLVRYLPAVQPIAPIAVEGPLRILLALSSPGGHPRDELAHEWERLRIALEPLIDAGQLELQHVPGSCTFDNLKEALLHSRPHVFHFVGHGQAGALMLEQASGTGLALGPLQLRSVFPSGGLPRLIVLNARSGGTNEALSLPGLAQGFLRQGVPAVVAMRPSLTDGAGLIFSRYFYRHLVETGAVDASLTEARLRVRGNGHPLEWGTPLLYMRAPGGQLFQVSTSQALSSPRAREQPRPSQASEIMPAQKTEPPLNARRKSRRQVPRAPRWEAGADKREAPQTGESRADPPWFAPAPNPEAGSPVFRAPVLFSGMATLSEKLRQYLRHYLPRETKVPASVPPLAAEGGSCAVEVPPPAMCHFLAEMDQQVLLNRTSTIEVIISRELIERMSGSESAQAAGPIDPTRTLLVQVVPKSNFILADTQTDRAEIDPPLAGEAKSLYFDVKGAYPGPGEIWIIVRQRQTGIVRLVLKPNVVDRAQAARTAREKAEASSAEAPVLTRPFDQLLVIEQTIGDKVQYMFELDMPSINVFEQHTSKPLQVKREDYVNTLYREIEDRYLSHYSEATGTADVEAFTAELQAYGVSLFDQLLPREVQAQLWKHHSKLKSIRVVSTEPFIPWEIVHLKAPGEPLDPDAPALFLGQMGLVRWLHNVNGQAPVQLRVRDGYARYVIPDYPDPNLKLHATAKERAFLEQRFAATAVTPQPNELRKLLSHAGTFDLLHFACHGEARQEEIGYARLLLEGRVEAAKFIPTWLDASTVEAFASLREEDGTQPIVFLNACKAGRAGYKLTGIGGFAQAFLRAGAGAFVGTLWSVGDEPAFSFGQVFYEALLSGQRVPVATTAAREAARRAGDATWLAYVVYAHPHARLTA